MKGHPALVALIVLALMMVASVAASGSAPDTSAAYAKKDGVTYYMAYGRLGTASVASAPAYDGAGLIPFQGCSIVQARPSFGHARVSMFGRLESSVDLFLSLDDFHGTAPGMHDGLAANLTVDGSLEHGSPLYPQVGADFAAWGTAHGLVLYPPVGDPMVDAPANFTDPVSGGSDFDASVVVTQQGFRDNATHAILGSDGKVWAPGGQAALDQGREVHLHLESQAKAPGEPQTETFSSSGTIDGFFAPSEQHNATFVLRNSMFGGTAKVHISSSALAPAGNNEVHFVWFSPTGERVGDKTVTPALGADSGADLSFALDHFGTYTLAVTGRVALSQYQVDVTMAPPAKFALDFWWDGVTIGLPAANALGTCVQQLSEQGNDAVVPAPTTVGRERPPGYPMELVLAAVASAAAIGLFFVKLTMETVGTASYKRSYRK